MNKKGNPQNLTPLKKGDPRCKEMQLKSAAAHKRNNLERKKMRDELNTLLNASLRKGTLTTPEEIMSLEQAKKKNISVQTAINVAMIQRAILGDVQAAIWVRDTLGEKPSDKVEMDQSLTIESWAQNHKVKL